MADTNQTYLTLISTAIRDFDSIYGALVDRGVATYTGLTDGNKYNTGVATSEYAGLIRKLYKVTDKLGADVDLSTYALEYKDNLSAKTATINTTSGLIEFTPSALAVVDGSSKITATLTPVSLGISNFKAGDDAYVYTAPNNTIVKDVTIDKGSVALNIEAATVSEWEPTVTTESVAVGNQLGANILKSELAEGTTGYTAFTVTPTVNVTGSKTITLAANKGFTFTPGYIESLTDTDLSKEISTNGKYTPTTASTLYIQNAALRNVKANGAIGFDKSEIKGVGKDEDGYNIIADAALSVSGDVTPGFLGAGSKLESDGTSPISSTLRIKKGTVSDVSITNTLQTTGDTTILSSATSDVYTITVTAPAVSENKSIDYGYVKSDDAGFKVTAVKKEETIKIDKGSIVAKADAKVNKVTGNGTSLTAGANGTTEAITVNISAEFKEADQSTKAGYVTSATRTAAAAKDVEIHLTKSKATKDSLSLSASVVDTEDGKDATNKGTAVNIFQDDAPESGDYYKIDAVSEFSISAGYTSAGLSGGKEKQLYLPKATLKYVADSDAGNILQVVTGGYLPSGNLIDFSEIEGKLDEADVKVSLTGPAWDINKKAYIISAVYNDSASGIGYFNGAANFTGASVELAKGTATQVASIDSSTVKGITSNGDDKYQVTLSTKGKTTTTIVNGYITGSDVTVNGAAVENSSDVEISGETTVELDKATLGLKATTVDLGATPTGFAFSEDETDFVITPNFGTNHTVTIKPTADGYTTTNDETPVTLTTGTVGTYYLKAGSVDPITAQAGNAKITLQSDFDTKTSGDYTVVIPTGTTVAATATINEGYINAPKVTGNVSVESNALTVARGSVSPVVSSVSATLSSSEVSLETAPIADETLFALHANASATSTANVTKAGYIKQTEVGTADTREAEQVTHYVKGIKLDAVVSTESTNGKVYNYANFGVDKGAAVDEAIIASAERYAKYDIKVSLHADAMGTNVRSELSKLEARLLGNAVTAASTTN